jgi:regulatory protein
MSLTEQEILGRMFKYCALRERSPAEVRKKITELAGGSSLVAPLTARLFKEGFLNEERFAAAFLQGKMNSRKWGLMKLRAALMEHGIAEMVIRKTLDGISDLDYELMMGKELEKKWRSLKQDDFYLMQTKLMRFGLQRGYSAEAVKTWLRKFTVGLKDSNV